MWTTLMICVVCCALGGFLLFSALKPFRRIWAGDASAAGSLPTRGGTVKARNYLAYLFWIIPAATGFLLLGVTAVASALVHAAPRQAQILPMTGVCLLLSAFPLSLIHAFVNATNRPYFLVPPPYRDQPGSIAAWQKVRRRRAEGLPPTNHLVEIIEVPDDDSPWLMALCDEPECGWDAWPDFRRPAPDPEAELRAQARTHTTNIAPDIVRPDLTTGS